MKAWIRAHALDLAVIAAGLCLAVALRASLLEFKSGDYYHYTKEWYNTLKAEGFAAFRRDFSNYNLPYLYLLYAVVRFLPDLSPVVAIKIPAMVADFVSAWLIFQIVHQKFRSNFLPLLAAFSVLVAPTLVLNSAFWGQADAVYTTFLLASLLCLVKGRGAVAMAAFGLALAFKAQSLFLVPLLGALILRREIRLRTVLWIPLVFFLTLMPAWLAGRPFAELLLIYPAQAGQYGQLSMHAPSALAWIPDTGRYFGYFQASALVLAAAAAVAYVWAVFRSPSRLTAPLLVELALIAAVLMPFCLPKMHERYFYLADELSIALAFFVPSLFYVPVLMICISFFAYQPALFGAEPVPMGVLALGVLVVIIVLLRHALPRLLAPAADQL